jgi:acyl dehydratase
MNKPVRIGDTVRLIAERKAFAVGALCKVTKIDVLNNKVTITNKKEYPCVVKFEDIEIVSSPEWQLKLI